MTCCKACGLFLILLLTASAQPPPRPAKPVGAKAAAAKQAKPAAPVKPEVLTNASILRMVGAGLDEDTILAKIKSTPANFSLGTDDLILLKEAKIPQRVLRAMLGQRTGEPQAAAPTVVTDPGPLVVAAPAVEPPTQTVPTLTDHVVARQGATIVQLANKPQKVLFVKSEATDIKTAVANILLSDVGLQLLTMGMSSQMMMWNPYMGDTILKAANIGKGMLLNKSSDTKGFEIETLPGLTADVTLKEGKTEFFIPVNRYIPSANFDPATVEPVLLRLEPRDKDTNRVLSGRKVTLKQEKKGRFDLKPTTDRQESNVEQTIVPVTVERMPDNVFKVTTQADLKRGEYAMVFRKKDAAGAYTSNVPLKPDAPPAAVADAAAEAIPGMTPEMMAMLGPQQAAAMQQQMQQQNAGQQQRGGLFGRMKAAPAAPPPGDGPMTGFIAWDFRVLP